MPRTALCLGLTLIACLTALTGCISNPDYGQGPLSLSYRVKASFDQYLRLSNPYSFAVSVDGNYAGWSYCEQGIAGTGCQATPHGAVSYCESSSRGVPCKLYAMGRNVVWQGGPVTLHPDSLAQQSAAMPPDAMKQSIRPIAVQWEGYSDLIVGTVNVSENSAGGKVTMRLPKNEGDCQGNFTYDQKGRGSWATSCTNGLAASGVLELTGDKKGSIGKGTDSRGRAVKFTVGAAAQENQPTRNEITIESIRDKIAVTPIKGEIKIGKQNVVTTVFKTMVSLNARGNNKMATAKIGYEGKMSYVNSKDIKLLKLKLENAYAVAELVGEGSKDLINKENLKKMTGLKIESEALIKDGAISSRETRIIDGNNNVVQIDDNKSRVLAESVLSAFKTMEAVSLAGKKIRQGQEAQLNFDMSSLTGEGENVKEIMMHVSGTYKVEGEGFYKGRRVSVIKYIGQPNITNNNDIDDEQMTKLALSPMFIWRYVDVQTGLDIFSENEFSMFYPQAFSIEFSGLAEMMPE